MLSFVVLSLLSLIGLGHSPVRWVVAGVGLVATILMLLRNKSYRQAKK